MNPGDPSPPDASSFLVGQNLQELERTLASFDSVRYRPAQLYHALYRLRADSLDSITNLPSALRSQLRQRFHLNPVTVQRTLSSVDGTRKYLAVLPDGRAIECVWMPEDHRDTICLSTQAGCQLACSFCMTALMGLERNLTAGEMVGQVIVVLNDVYGPGSFPKHGVNVVLMGMGEPLLNYENVLAAIRLMADPRGVGISTRRITLSTAGIVPKIVQLGRELVRPRLAISLTATTNDLRNRLMPINLRYPIEALLSACREFPLKPRERITFEYVMLKDVNDGEQDARRLAALLKGIRSKVNLIAHNSTPELPYSEPQETKMLAFQRVLFVAGMATFIRLPRGRDILAACGQLRAREEILVTVSSDIGH